MKDDIDTFETEKWNVQYSTTIIESCPMVSVFNLCDMQVISLYIKQN